jgi:hypothetical protein
MLEAGVDWRMMPLGRFDNEQITKGYQLLQQIEDVIKKIADIHNLRGKKLQSCVKDVSTLFSLSSAYHSLSATKT